MESWFVRGCPIAGSDLRILLNQLAIAEKLRRFLALNGQFTYRNRRFKNSPELTLHRQVGFELKVLTMEA